MFKENLIIFENPDGSLQLGNQPHYKNKKVIECYNCKIEMICNIKDIIVECYSCQKLNKNIKNIYFGKKLFN